jgi:hypothetical protein
VLDTKISLVLGCRSSHQAVIGRGSRRQDLGPQSRKDNSRAQHRQRDSRVPIDWQLLISDQQSRFPVKGRPFWRNCPDTPSNTQGVKDQAVTNAQMAGMSHGVMSVVDAGIDRFAPGHAKYDSSASRTGPVLINKTSLPPSRLLSYCHNLLPRVRTSRRSAVRTGACMGQRSPIQLKSNEQLQVHSYPDNFATEKYLMKLGK